MTGHYCYVAIAEELSDPRTTLADLNPKWVRKAQLYAAVNHQAWPPKPTSSGWLVTIQSF